VGATTADEQRRADRTVTRAARALLLVDLLARTGDRSPFLAGLGALAPRGELGGNDLVEQVLLDLGAEYLVAEIELADLFPLQIEDVDFCHR
jgi:hypothetical protein